MKEENALFHYTSFIDSPMPSKKRLTAILNQIKPSQVQTARTKCHRPVAYAITNGLDASGA